MDPKPEYPAEWETHAVLRDGSTAEIRPIRPTDREALVRFHGQQSRESIYFRYFRYRPELSEAELDHFTRVDYRDRMAFVAMQGGELIAVARYETWGPGERSSDSGDHPTAEVAFFVHDDHQGKGLGTLMLEYLAAAARHRGLVGFTATVLSENYRMLGVFRSAGFDVSTRFADGAIEVELGIEVTSQASSAIADRHRLATARSVARILEARTVAVIGASREPGAVGHELVRHLLDGGGRDGDEIVVLAVNPATTEILGRPCFPTVAEAARSVADRGDGEGGGGDGGRDEGAGEGADEAQGPHRGAIDLAVIAVQADLVPDIVRQCVDVGVAGLLIVSVGFSDIDEVGRAREREIVELARNHGIRLIGPAAFGLVNTAAPGLCAVYHPVAAMAGRVGVGSQSGPLGAAMLDRLARRDVGVSSFVGLGNRADVSVNDLLDYWSLDPSTDAVVLYVENFGNLRNLSTVARRTSQAKPIVTVRPSSPDQVELLHQSGVILVDEVSQLVEQVELAVTQPVARGDRVALVSNSASVARLCAAACRRHDLQLVVPAGVADAARGDSVLIGDLDSVALRPSSDPADYERVVVATAVSDEVDLVLLALTPHAYFDRDELAGLLSRINRAIDKPVVAVGLVPSDVVPVEGLPLHAFPESAARALARHARYGQWRAAHAAIVHDGPRRGVSPSGVGSAGGSPLDQRVAGVVERLLAGRSETVVTLASPDLPELLDGLGIPLAPWGSAAGLDEAIARAEEIGYPVVLKAANLTSRSLGEWGGTAIDLHDGDDLEAAYRRMTATLGVAMRTSVVQRMVASVATIRLELLQDPAFGAMISIGAGGQAQVGTTPVARRFLPLDRSEARSLVRAMADRDELAGIDPAVEGAVADLVQALVAAAQATEHLARVTLNPILLSADQAVPTDAEVTLRRSDRHPLSGVRHL